MLNLVITLPAGIAILVLAFVVLYRLTPLNGKQAAVVTALIAIAGYLPYALVVWPGVDVFAIHIAVYLVTAYILGILGSQRDAGYAGGERRKWFHWGPAAIVVFFLVIIIMDGVFVTVSQEGLPQSLRGVFLPEPRGAQQAQTKFPGVIHEHYYQKESRYNDYLRQREAQEQRGWTVRKGWLTERPQAGRNAVLQVSVEDRNGDVIRGAEVRGRFVRPSNAEMDRHFTMGEVSPGVYRVAVALPEPGTWRLDLTVRKGEMVHEVRASTTVYEAALADSR